MTTFFARGSESHKKEVSIVLDFPFVMIYQDLRFLNTDQHTTLKNTMGHPFFRCRIRPLAKKYAPKSYDQMKKEPDLSDLSPKKIPKVLMKIEEMADVFLKSANFASHASLSLAPPSGYALNLKALIKVSKVS